MTYTTAAKTDKPTNWKALWISFGDVAFSKKNDSHGSDLAFNRSEPWFDSSTVSSLAAAHGPDS